MWWQNKSNSTLCGADNTGSILSLANDQDVLFSSQNDTATGDPQQFVLKHQLGNTELINRRGDLILSSSTKRIGINETNPVHALQVDGNISASGDLFIEGNITASAGNFCLGYNRKW